MKTFLKFEDFVNESELNETTLPFTKKELMKIGEKAYLLKRIDFADKKIFVEFQPLKCKFCVAYYPEKGSNKKIEKFFDTLDKAGDYMETLYK